MARIKNGAKDRTARTTSKAHRAPKVVEAPRPRSVEELFAGPRPASFSRGLEPAFLLIDREVMEQLCKRAAALGLGGYDMLVKRILREHVHEY
jgi:hypothetical protein